MQILTLTNALAFFAFCTVLLSLWEVDKEQKRQKNIKRLIVFIFGIAVLITTICKNSSDREASSKLRSSQDSLNKTLSSLDSTNQALTQKISLIDTLNTYVKRVDSIGVRRNESTNQPVITSKFYNKIDKVNTLNQY